MTLRLIERQAFFEGEVLDRVGPPAFLVRCAEHRHHVVAPLQHGLQHRLTEGLLAVHDNPHRLVLPESSKGA
jgi:hypothetical protein